jgi:hypothetical protein
VILAMGSRLPIRLRAVMWAALGLAGAAIAPLHFVQLKPALDAQHGWTLGVGWGIVLTVVGFVVVAAAGVVDWRRA